MKVNGRILNKIGGLCITISRWWGCTIVLQAVITERLGKEDMGYLLFLTTACEYTIISLKVLI